MKTSKEMLELSASMTVLLLGVVIKNLPLQIIGTVLVLVSLKKVKDQFSKPLRYLVYTACIAYIFSLLLYLLSLI
jgi:uncharacterized membrane protein